MVLGGQNLGTAPRAWGPPISAPQRPPSLPALPPSLPPCLLSPHRRLYHHSGASGCFRADLHHASVEPKSDDEHLKIAFFFRKSTRGERRAKRALAECDEGATELELAQRRKMVAAQHLL